MSSKFSHRLPGEHIYDGILFFGFSPPETLNAVREFRVRDDDVFIVTYPKAGTTWMQEILWLILNEGDLEGARKKQVYFRSPFLEFKDDILNEIGIDLADPMPSPRVIKSHLQVQMMPKEIYQTDSKVILVFRNPKDVCVSYYHFYRSSSSVGNYEGTWAEFLEMFKDGHVDHGSWFDFTRGWWTQRNNPNVKIVYFEDMKKDLSLVIKELCQFLEKSLNEDLIERISKHCSFESMKTNPMTNHHDVYSINRDISPLLRKGTVGDWKNSFTVAQNEDFDAFLQDKIGDLEIPFKYEL